MLGLLGIVLINLFGHITIDNEHNYYSLKEVTKAAMIDAVDEYSFKFGVGDDGVTRLTDPTSMHCAAGVPGTIRILKERFVELFIIKFANTVNDSRDYTITFYDIDECPPKVTVKVESKQSYSMLQKFAGISDEQEDEVDIVNEISAILESKDAFN